MSQVQNIAVLYSRLSGYVASCLRALREQHQVELLVVRIPQSDSAPFEDRHFDWIEHLYDKSELNRSELKELLFAFQPDGVFMSGWFDRDYRSVARTLRGRGVPVVAGCDNQWKGTLRQHIGRLVAPWYLHTAIDVLWVAGERQRQFASRLGYTGKHCWDGEYACDWSRFAEVYSESESSEGNEFLFLGRYAPEKGIDVLMDAYARYREEAENPWPLRCAGAGPKKARIGETDGVIDHGFTQPDDVPALMRKASAFVLPSRSEPWGVVVQEAAAAGLPLICTEASGAAVHLLRDGYNGLLVQPENVGHLSEALRRMSAFEGTKREEMGRRSHELSKQYTPERWANTLVNGVRRLHSDVGDRDQSKQCHTEFE